MEVTGCDGSCSGGRGVEVYDELGAVVGVELVWDILFDDKVLAGKPGGFVHPAAESVVDIGDDLEGVVAMGIGDAVGEEDG